jgi:hypothetical protein
MEKILPFLLRHSFNYQSLIGFRNRTIDLLTYQYLPDYFIIAFNFHPRMSLTNLSPYNCRDHFRGTCHYISL